MRLASFEAIIAALEHAKVRYLVAGGVAVNAHGHLRLTADVDLVIRLEEKNILAALEALGSLGYRPIVPVTVRQFADQPTRERWAREKGMTVLNLQSDAHPLTGVDIFVTEPFDFEKEYGAALVARLSGTLTARFVSIPALIKMKEAAGRPVDLDDIKHLRWILDEQQKP